MREKKADGLSWFQEENYVSFQIFINKLIINVFYKKISTD